MKLSIMFIRNFFIFLSALLMTAYVMSTSSEGDAIVRLGIGLGSGLGFGFLLAAAGRVIERFNLRVFNVAALGLFFGFLMGEALMGVIRSFLDIGLVQVDPAALGLTRALVFLATIYLGLVLTARASEEISISIPFIRFQPQLDKKKDLLVDSSALLDTRLLDLVNTGLFDQSFIVPQFIVAELQAQSEDNDENIKARGRRGLDTLKRLESLPSLGLRFSDTDFSELKDSFQKLERLGKLLNAGILSADTNRMQQSEEGVRIVNIHALANALKPLAQSGECFQIKIQRYGKEARQGVGYLEDGTMVVVNGGAPFIGDTIRVRVLSVKHTTSGRMVFCNALEEGLEQELTREEAAIPASPASKRYFSI